MQIVIMPVGSETTAHGAKVVLKDYGMIWCSDDTIWMTQKAWDKYQQTRKK